MSSGQWYHVSNYIHIIFNTNCESHSYLVMQYAHKIRNTLFLFVNINHLFFYLKNIFIFILCISLHISISIFINISIDMYTITYIDIFI